MSDRPGRDAVRGAKLPSAEDCRGPPRHNGRRPVRWDVVDPFLRNVRGNGALTTLAKALGISRQTLWERRVALGLPPLPTGRAEVTTLTEKEAEAVKSIGEGKSKSQLAREQGVTRQAIHNLTQRAEEKQERASRECSPCRGRGVVECGSNGETPCTTSGHMHVCEPCKGSGRVAP